MSGLLIAAFNYLSVFAALMSRLFAGARWGDQRCLPLTPRPCRVRAVPFDDLEPLHQHLAGQFHRHPKDLHADRVIPDPRTAQIARPTTENTTLRTRLAATSAELHEPTAFKILIDVRRCAQRMRTWKVEF